MNEKEIQQILKEIDSLIKKIEEGGEEPSQEFLDLLDEVNEDIALLKEEKKEKHSKDLTDKLDKLIQITSDGGNLSSESSKNIISAIGKIKITTPAPVVNVAPPKVSVTVPPIKSPQVNVPETVINFPDEMSIKKPYWLQPLKPITDLLQGIKKAIGEFVLPKSADDPVSVRLSDGEKFYRAIGGMASAYGTILTFKNIANEAKAALVDSDDHLQVDVQSMPPVTVTTGDIEIGAVEIKNSTDDTRATVGADGLYVDVQASALPSGAATAAKQLPNDHDVTVSNMIPAVETGLATSAKQLPDNHQVTVSNIASTPVITGFATSAKQLADNHQVTVSNMIPAVETGLATSAKQDTLLTEVQKKPNNYATNAIDDYTTASVTYICKEDSDTANWWFIKIDETGNFPVFTHATVTNNATKTTYALAYADRTTLTYQNYNLAF